MIVISFDAECVTQHTAPEIAALSRDERFCVGITGDMTEEQREILLAQHVPVLVPGETRPRMATPLLLWSRLLPGDNRKRTLQKVYERLPNASKFWHVVAHQSFGELEDGWEQIDVVALAEKLRAA